LRMHAAQGTERRPRTAGNGGAFGEGQFIGERHHGARRRLQIFRVTAVAGHAVDHESARHSCDHPTRQWPQTPQPASGDS
jgi:hypothetical protein